MQMNSNDGYYEYVKRYGTSSSFYQAGEMGAFGYAAGAGGAGASQFKVPGIKPFSYKKQYNHFNGRFIKRGIDSAQAQDALDNPLQVGEIRYDNMGRASQQYIGEKVTVVINPDTGKRITVWPTSSKTVKKLKGGS